MNLLDNGLFSSSQEGAGFDAFILDRGGGNRQALVRYLQARRQMFLHDSSKTVLRNENPAHLLRAVEVIGDALELLDRFKHVDFRRVLQTTGREEH
uniref:HEPN domain-containing protein n=1 Tax=Chelativorans sp. (strain BNC1) TaxID=266779 RepID=Q11M70_CHESB